MHRTESERADRELHQRFLKASYEVLASHIQGAFALALETVLLVWAHWLTGSIARCWQSL